MRSYKKAHRLCNLIQNRVIFLAISIGLVIIIWIAESSVPAAPVYNPPFLLPTGCCENEAEFMQLISGDHDQGEEWQDWFWENVWKPSYPGLVDSDRLGNATWTYNCHSYIFHDGIYWLNDQTPFFGDESGCWQEDANGTIRSRTGSECHSCTLDYTGKCGGGFLQKRNDLVYGTINTIYKKVSVPIPTLSEWKRIFLTLFIVASGIAFMRYRQYAPAQFVEGLDKSKPIRGAAIFEGASFRQISIWCSISAIIGMILILILYGKVTSLDILGIIICSPLLAYILNAAYMELRQTKN